jgi:aldose 1-epimerase
MPTSVTVAGFGAMPDGTPVKAFTLVEGPIEARVITYGGVLVSLKVPGRTGKLDDIVLGCDSLADYVRLFNSDANPYFGTIVGRYANRVARGKFTLEGKHYSVPVNDGPNSLHGGPHGFHNVVWQGKQISDGVELNYVSKDGEEGYPGELSVTVRYTLKNSALQIEYLATTNKPTIVNLSHHSYFNLLGEGKGDILGHQLVLFASRFTPIDSTSIPTGELKSVSGTAFDFGTPHPIGERIDANDEQLRFARGYDHNWVLDSGTEKLSDAAEVYEPTTGRLLRVATTQPGIQFYTGNFLDGSLRGKSGALYVCRGGFCLETQHFPDSPNHPEFPSTELRRGERYQHETLYRFAIR